MAIRPVHEGRRKPRIRVAGLAAAKGGAGGGGGAPLPIPLAAAPVLTKAPLTATWVRQPPDASVTGQIVRPFLGGVAQADIATSAAAVSTLLPAGNGVWTCVVIRVNANGQSASPLSNAVTVP